MKNRTCTYMTYLARARYELAVQKNTLKTKLNTYIDNNKNIMYNDNSIVYNIYTYIHNYTEYKVCEYARSKECSKCNKDIYICGINCKLCGVYICAYCACRYKYVYICSSCYSLVRECNNVKPEEDQNHSESNCSLQETTHTKKANNKTGLVRAVCSPNTLAYYAELEKCLKHPNQKSIKKLLSILNSHQIDNSIEDSGAPSDINHKIQQNILIRMKIAVCDWYVYKAREERYLTLFEQLEYLEVLRTESISNNKDDAPIAIAIQEILKEIADTDEK
ncbi:hypothetical protein NEIRO02_1443 [Nematocida sp. AWRm79]|nr:hypothetical protein NEIRO02_1443 [Nematocida sp. AWRm79]